MPKHFDRRRLEPLIDYLVVVNGLSYDITASDSQSAVRSALYQYLRVYDWDCEYQLWWSCSSTNAILDSLSSSIRVKTFLVDNFEQ